MTIGDGFNIWMGKFLWDCVEVFVLIVGICVVAAIAERPSKLERERAKKEREVNPDA